MWMDGCLYGHVERTNRAAKVKPGATLEAKVLVLKDSEHGLKPLIH